MQCPQCGFENRDDARFCKRCGHELPGASPHVLSNCPACGAALKPGAHFCARCGQALAPPSARQPVPSPVQSVPPVPPIPVPAYRDAPMPSPIPSVEVAGSSTPKPSPAKRTERSTVGWLLALTALGLMFCLSCCGVLILGLLPALNDTPPTAISGDPAGHDITILVREAYLNENLVAILPEKGLQNASLDVQPNNLLVTTAKFDLVFVSLELKIVARLSVVDGEIEVSIEDIVAGGSDLMQFLNMDEVTLGKNFTRALREQLENELGEGSRLLDITTDEEHIILRARL